MTAPFSAAPLIEFLRGQLWRSKPGRTAGRASVMIGAGFSRNADPSTAEARPFPTWYELTDRLAHDLDPLSRRASDPVRVAQEYEAMFGRGRLDETIRSLIPDGDNKPSDLHRRLLALPWADIFTTNWDTLLERACPEAYDRMYDLIVTPSQVPSAALPRIVKLHGTLPANGPFIVTEEDFRTYPRLFAPFVNLVQQAMMETSMVLLGFSGDDPNFLQWSGWVRDNLGQHTPQIYLVGWLALTPHRRRMLEERKVLPIDLSELPDARAWPEELRHRWALEWFLHAMEGGRPPRLLTWPEPDPEMSPPKSALGWIMPPRSDGRLANNWPGADLEANDTELITAFRSVIAMWRTERERHPGWWILPSAARRSLWVRSSHWLVKLSKGIELLPMPERISAIAEVLRRLEMCLLDATIVCGLPVLVEEMLAAVAPDGSTWSADGKAGALGAAEREDWRSCLLVSARLARLRGDVALHESRLSTLETASSSSQTARNEATFERATRHAQFLQDDEMDALLDAWDASGSDAAWGIRKAGLLAGAGREAEARAELVAALAHARRNRRGDVLDLAALSREGWGLVLGLAWHGNPFGETDSFVEVGERDPWGRWEDLGRYGCDGWSDIHELMADMREPPPPPTRQRVRGFESGTISESIHFRSGLPIAYRAGKQMLRLADATGLPASANHVSLLREALERVVEACGPSDAPVSLILLLARISGVGDDKAIHRYLTRARVATLADNDIDQLIATLHRRISTARRRIETGRAGEFWTSRFRIAVEIFSRLMPRCSDGQAREAFNLACELVESGWSPAHPFVGGEIRNLFSRIVARLPSDELPSAFFRAVFLLLPDEGQACRERGQTYPFNDFIRRTPELRIAIATKSLRPDPVLVRNIITQGQMSPFMRRHSIARLQALDSIGLLTAAESQSFAELVWGSMNSSKPCLPADLDFYPWAFLLMPEQHEGQAAEAFRQEFLRGRERRDIGASLWNVGVALDEMRGAGRPFVLSEEDLASLAASASSWASLAFTDQERRDAMGRDDEELAQEGLARILIAARLPDNVMTMIQTKVIYMQSGPARRVSGLRLTPGLVKADPDIAPSVAAWLRRALVSVDPRIAGEALRTLSLWLQAVGRNSGMLEPPDDLTEEVANMLTARRPGTVGPALDFARWLFDEGPSRLRESMASRCDLALSYLADETSYVNEVLAGHEAELDVPWVRQNAMGLAGAMGRAGFGEIAGVKRWLIEGADDPLYEVRRAVNDRDE